MPGLDRVDMEVLDAARRLAGQARRRPRAHSRSSRECGSGRPARRRSARATACIRRRWSANPLVGRTVRTRQVAVGCSVASTNAAPEYSSMRSCLAVEVTTRSSVRYRPTCPFEAAAATPIKSYAHHRPRSSTGLRPTFRRSVRRPATRRSATRLAHIGHVSTSAPPRPHCVPLQMLCRTASLSAAGCVTRDEARSPSA